MGFQASIFALLAATATIVEAVSPGCGKSPVASGTKSVTIDGQSRQYILKVPATYDPTNPYKLVFGYHWLGGTMQNVANGFYGLEALSEGSAIFVAPQGIDNGWGNANGNDVAFTDAMLKAVQDELCVNEAEIFALGWSYGGAMSFSLACSRPDVFRAVAIYSGAQLSGCDGGNTPVAYLGIHGVVDSVLSVDRGRDIRDKFIGLNGCAAKDAPEPAPGSGSHIKTEYSCTRKPVTWIAHSGDHVPDPRDADGTYWAPGETWSFFEQAP